MFGICGTLPAITKPIRKIPTVAMVLVLCRQPAVIIAGRANGLKPLGLRFAFDRPAIINNLVELVPCHLIKAVIGQKRHWWKTLNVAKNLGRRRFIFKMPAQKLKNYN